MVDSDAVWRRDGGELFYLGPNNTLMAREVRPAATFELGPPQRLFQMNMSLAAIGSQYDVSIDGKSFLVADCLRHSARLRPLPSCSTGRLC